jgi:hypothetical protein
VWIAAAVVLAAMGVCVVSHATKRTYPAFTGTNSIGFRGTNVLLTEGHRLCVPSLEVPRDTGFVRLKVLAGAPRPTLHAALSAGGVVARTRATLPVTGNVAIVDMPVAPRSGGPQTVPGTLCLTVSNGAAAFGGMAHVYDGEPQRWVTIDGKRLDAIMVGVWFLPDARDRTTLAGIFPTIAKRASLFRPALVAPWLYWVIVLGVVPLLVFVSIRTLALVSAPGRVRIPLVALVGIVAFANAAAWALITPPFDAPDEQEHFSYAQYLAETGKAPARDASPLPVWSGEETIALDGVLLPSYSEQQDARPPWLHADERHWAERQARQHPRRDDGGGKTAATTHSPLYYGVQALPYRAFESASIFTRLTAMRLLSALLGAVAAMFTYLLIAELFPRQRILALGGGLLVAFQPMFTFISGAVNNDVGVNAAAAALAYLLIRGLRRGLTVPVAIALGVAVIVAPLAKGTGLALYPAVVLSLAGMAWRFRPHRHVAAYAALAVSVVATAGIWLASASAFGRSYLTTPGGTAPTASGGVGGSALQHPKTYLSYLWQEFLPRLPFMTDLQKQRWPAFDVYVERGWAAFGWYAILFPRWVYGVIAAAMILAGVLVAVSVIRHRRFARSRAWELLVLVACVAGVVAGVAAAYWSATARPTPAEQGRYAFTAIAPLAAIAIGAATVLGRRFTAPLVASMVAAVAGLYFASQLLALSSFYT